MPNGPDTRKERTTVYMRYTRPVGLKAGQTGRQTVKQTDRQTDFNKLNLCQ